MSVLMRFIAGNDYHDNPQMLTKLINLSLDMLSSLIRGDQWRVILGLLPPSIRRLVPLSLWPEWIGEQLELVDISVDIVENYRTNWREGDEDGTFLNIIESDRSAGRITDWDAIWTIQQLIG